MFAVPAGINSPTFSSYLVQAVFWQSICYLGSFCICWPLVGITGFYLPESWGFWLVISMLAPLQGCLDCCIYFRPRILKWLARRSKKKESNEQETAPPPGQGGGSMRTLFPSLLSRVTARTESYFVSRISQDKCLDRLEAVSEEAANFRESGVTNFRESGVTVTNFRASGATNLRESSNTVIPKDEFDLKERLCRYSGVKARVVPTDR